MQMIGYKIGNGDSIRMWLEPWLDSKILLELIEDVRFENPPGREAHLNSLIANHTWEVPIPRSFSLIDIYRTLPHIDIH